MKQLFSIIWQAVLLYLAALVGFVTGVAKPALRVTRVLSRTPATVRTYDFDWVIAVLLVYALLLLVSAARKRVRANWLSTTIALLLVLAGVVLFTQLGLRETAT